MTVKWSPYAVETYKLMVINLQNKWPDKIVLGFQKSINNQIELIKSNNSICPASITTGLRKCKVHKHVALIYRIHKTEIEIVALIDNRSSHEY